MGRSAVNYGVRYMPATSTWTWTRRLDEFNVVCDAGYLAASQQPTCSVAMATKYGDSVLTGPNSLTIAALAQREGNRQFTRGDSASTSAIPMTNTGSERTYETTRSRALTHEQDVKLSAWPGTATTYVEPARRGTKRTAYESAPQSTRARRTMRTAMWSHEETAIYRRTELIEVHEQRAADYVGERAEERVSANAEERQEERAEQREEEDRAEEREEEESSSSSESSSESESTSGSSTASASETSTTTTATTVVHDWSQPAKKRSRETLEPVVLTTKVTDVTVPKNETVTEWLEGVATAQSSSQTGRVVIIVAYTRRP